MENRIGSGVVIISITVKTANHNAPADIIGFVADVVASMTVSTGGHLTAIEPVGLIRIVRDN